jgi:hypothetical protein
MFSYGHPNDPRKDDQRFESKGEAFRAAEKHQSDKPWDGLLVVWDDATGEILALLLDGQLFLPA